MTHRTAIRYQCPVGALVGWTAMDLFHGKPVTWWLVCIVIVWLVANALWDAWHFDAP